jgi:tRNA pseudouridine38-40 synthase
MISRWKVVCSYDGTDFSGWQCQPDNSAIQDVIEKRLSEILSSNIRIHASGRTDAGVHARGQVFHFDGEWNDTSSALAAAIQSRMPESVSIDSMDEVSNEFHARFSALGKLYVYRFYRGIVPPHLVRFTQGFYAKELDVESMKSAIKLYEGWHDFRSFSVNRGEAYEDTWRYMHECKLKIAGPHIDLSFEGNGFMYKMVRSMVGAILEVGKRKLDVSELEAILTGAFRGNRIVTAPAKGLTLETVFYNNREYPEPPKH